jgi:hypothetical protein
VAVANTPVELHESLLQSLQFVGVDCTQTHEVSVRRRVLDAWIGDIQLDRFSMSSINCDAVDARLGRHHQASAWEGEERYGRVWPMTK